MIGRRGEVYGRVPAGLAVLLAGLVLAGCDEPEGATGSGAAASPPSVTVTGVAEREIAERSTYVGRVEPVDSVDLIARVEGFLAERLVDNGALVSAGQPLLRLQRDQYEAALAQAKADLAEAEANLALAEIELDRDRKLIKSDTIAQSRLDATTATRDSTAALVEARRARVRLAELDLGYTEIAAPFPGRIGRIAYAPGELVGPGKGPIATLVRLSPIEVGFSISEAQYLAILRRIGGDEGLVWDNVEPADSPDVTLTLPGGAEFSETGQIVFIDNRVDPATGSVAMRARFDNARGLLAPGVYVTVALAARRPVLRMLVPQTAVQRDQKGDFVLVVGADGLVKQRHLSLGRTVGTDFVVEEGLETGESVITEGLQRVRPGVPVETVRADAQ